MGKIILVLLAKVITSFSCLYGQQVSPTYQHLQARIASGWNTWSYGSMLTHVLLPEGLAISINFRQTFIGTPGDDQYLLREASSNKLRLIKPVAHSFDGTYTELLIDNWYGNKIRVQSAALGEEVFILITPVANLKEKRYQIEVEAGMMWNKKGYVWRSGDSILSEIAGETHVIRSTGKLLQAYHPYFSPYIATASDSAVAFYTGPAKTLKEVTDIIKTARTAYYNYAGKYGNMQDAFIATQTVLAWNTIYDAEKNRVITPVSRGWNKAWHGYVLFAWDTYFASFLFALDNKELAYSNAIAVTKGINEGHIGHWQMPGNRSAAMSQPPVGSMICWKIYEKYRESWFLSEVYSELLLWNDWWISNRLNKGYLAWGGWKNAERQIAAWESGLDNSPMYDSASMEQVGNRSLLNLADVGLNSLYAADCRYLAAIAKVLGKRNDETVLLARAKRFSSVTQKLWNDSAGIYLNKYTQTGLFSKRLSPTLFYPMLAEIPAEEQAVRMIKEHFYNKEEFYGEYILPSCSRNDSAFDNQYWRGSIWGPMNFLAYLGLKLYDKAAARDLADKSYALFIEAWKTHQAVFENINSTKGVEKIEDQLNCDPFYHWGALMGIMKFMEENKY